MLVGEVSSRMIIFKKLTIQAAKELLPGTRIPQPKTVKRYGMTVDEWKTRLLNQGGRCAICRKLPRSGVFCVDHEHVKGWSKLKPHERKVFVRGIICTMCNRGVVGRGINLAILKGAVNYMLAYEKEKSKWSKTTK